MDITILHKGEEYDIRVTYFEAQAATHDCPPLGEIEMEIMGSTNPEPLSKAEREDIEDKAFDKMLALVGYSQYIEH